MKLTFAGAAHEVTGSCYLLEACGRKILIDCGMEQGRDLYENMDLHIPAGEIDLVLLTHAHIDHSGRIPLLYKQGYRGAVKTTPATVDLCAIMLRDSAHIQETEAQWASRKNRRAGQPDAEPLYTSDDAETAIAHLESVSYNERVALFEGIDARFTDIGHLLGSAAIELWISEDGLSRKIVFSGDVGNLSQPIIRDPSPVAEADYVVVESTYGDRLHTAQRPDYIGVITDILNRTFARGGNVVIPSFAVGRTQELLYFLREIKQRNLVTVHPDFLVCVDSPLAIEATHVFDRNYAGCYDEDALDIFSKGINPLVFPGLKTTVTTDESKWINEDKSPKVIIAASGMCDAGRIRHHLKFNVWRKESTVCFVGYQAEGSLGRLILDGAKQIKLLGETLRVACEIATIDGISGHADRDGLLAWLAGFAKKPSKIFVTHGEDTVTDLFARTVTERFGVPAYAPYPSAQADLATGEILYEGNRSRIGAPAAELPDDGGLERARQALARLKTALEKSGGTAAGLDSLTRQLGDLAASLENRQAAERDEH